MASLADVFKDQERTNWLKAWLAIDIVKTGLEHLADNEAQKFHQHIYSQVGSTCNSCSITHLLHHKQCQMKICDKVCQEITKEHRYNSLSWKNKKAELWQTNYWEIAKCYFPPDGYEATSSIQDTDFNGVVSFMLNCTRFDSKFSFPITKGKPTHSAACLLYKAREIVKAVRHCPIVKVTDVDIQNYFTTFTNLLSDSTYLSQDSDAQNAVKKLAQLEKDTLLLTREEMICFLEAVDTTLKQHLKDVAKDVVDVSVNDLRVNTVSCIDTIQAYLDTCKQELAKQAESHKQAFAENADKISQAFHENADKTSQAFAEKADKTSQAFTENADKRTQAFTENAVKTSQAFAENADKTYQAFAENADKRTQAFIENAVKTSQAFAENADKTYQAFAENADKRTQAFTENAVKTSQVFAVNADKTSQAFAENADKRTQAFTENAVKTSQAFAENADKTSQAFTENAYKCTQAFTENADKRTQAFAENADKTSQAFTENADKRTQAFAENADKTSQAFAEDADKTSQAFTENADKRTQAFAENADKHTQAFAENADKRTKALDENADKHMQDYDELTVTRKNEFDENADKHLRAINELYGNTTFTETFYKQSCEELLRAMMKHYAKTLSHVTTSPLNDWVQERLYDIYMPPDLQLMKKDKGSFMKAGTQITEYRNVFLTDGEPSRHMFIQGEAGSGKSTFLAKLVLDWCSANTTQSVEPLPPALTTSFDGDSSWKLTKLFKDLKTLTSYKFIFHVTLRDFVQDFEILEMIKQQTIDSIYSKKDRAHAYNLLNEIMKRERCLVLLDGFDEWTGTGGHNLPTLTIALSQCDMLFTTRPWKMTQSNIPDSNIDTLLQLEGVNEPFEVSKRLLACRGEYKESKALDNKQSEFISYVRENDLHKLLVSPMMLLLIVQSWTEGTKLKGSRCEIYSLLLESLLKKANSETSEFQRPPFRCFTCTQYIKPNNEHVNCLAEAAFNLLFSDKRENSLVFSISELKNSNSMFHEQERLDFALKSGILSATRKESLLRSSSAFSFIHKSMQEFLAAYHIARNAQLNLIDGVISEYLKSHEDAYLDISQVFIFLCGLDIMSVNMLSGLMDERNNARVKAWFDDELCSIILKGYREAVANAQTNIALTLSHLDCQNSNVRDAHSFWKNNTFSPLSLYIKLSHIYLPVADKDGSPATEEPPSHIEFNLSSCHMLKYLYLHYDGIWLKDSDSSAGPKYPVWIVLDNANPSQCTDPPPVLPSIKYIRLDHVRCSFTWLHSLFSTLLTVNHKVKCDIEYCEISPRVEGALIWKQYVNASITTDVNKCMNLSGHNAHDVELLFKPIQSLTQLKTFNIELDTEADTRRPSLWEALNSLYINRVTLSLDSVMCGLIVNNKSMLSQALLSNDTETICIYLNSQSNLMEDMHGLPIKSLILYGSVKSLKINHVSSVSTLLASLKKLEKLSFLESNDSPGLWEAVHSLNIKSLSLNDRKLHNVSSFAQFLSSLTHLETLNIKGKYASHTGLLDALHGLNIKSLSLNGLNFWMEDLKVQQMQQMKPLSRLFQSLTQLETLSIGVCDNYSSLSEALSEALPGLYITRLCLSGMRESLRVNNAELLSQSISSLTQLETLTLYVFAYIDLQLPQSLKYFNLYCTGISPPELRDLVKALSACTQSVESKLEFGCARCTYQYYNSCVEVGKFAPSVKENQTIISPEEYIPIQKELTEQRNITVKRFRMLKRIHAIHRWHSADFVWSVGDNVAVENNDNDDGIVDNETYNYFVQRLISPHRISVRLQSHAASNS
ncbi:hypothetical protein DPMN_161170 [Dreissena polymorpha]|uniref:NACHT domain-containing protein n=1 Tax=Dreissena polymorpha TaxID=45954 RepID=A0A9D4EN02_DREPO|nr:hypothetical protein DPMN_161170 [Dreissena polymorpha]